MEKIYIYDGEDNIILNVDKNRIFGYKFRNGRYIGPVDNSVYSFFASFALSSNRTLLESNENESVILDNETGLKHYFENGVENFEKLFINNGQAALSEKKNVIIDAALKAAKSFKFKKGNKAVTIVVGITSIALAASIGLAITAGQKLAPIINHNSNTQIEYNVPAPEVKDKEDMTHVASPESVLPVENNDEHLTNSDTEELVPEDPQSLPEIIPPVEEVPPVEDVPIKLPQGVELDTIKNLIYSSESLTDEEKAYIYNEDFYEDLLPLLNENDLLRYKVLNETLVNMKIIGYDSSPNNFFDYMGYSIWNEPNQIYVREYDGLNEYNKDTIAHENIHGHQIHNDQSFLNEACAEIISYEYYRDTHMMTYKWEVNYTKKLMETIGPEAIWNYTFTGNYDYIRNAISPYMTENESDSFIFALSQKQGDQNKEYLESTLKDLYQRIYSTDMDEDEAIKAIDDASKNDGHILRRYYFNRRLMDKENSYIEYQEIESKPITFEEAEGLNYIKFTQILNSKYITYDEAHMVYPSTTTITPVFSPGITIKTENRGNTTLYVCIVNGTRFEDSKYNALVDVLVQNGYAKYQLTETRTTTYKEIMEKHITRYNVVVQNDNVYKFSDVNFSKKTMNMVVPNGNVISKTYLPSISEKFGLEIQEKNLNQ